MIYVFNARSLGRILAAISTAATAGGLLAMADGA